MAEGRRGKRRMMHAVLSTSKKINITVKSHLTRLLYFMYYAHSDDYGRLEGDPCIIKAKAVPLLDDFTIPVIEKCTDELVQAVLWNRYTVDGDSFLEIVSFDEHQTGAFLRGRIPQYPAPPAHKVPAAARRQAQPEDLDPPEAPAAPAAPAAGHVVTAAEKNIFWDKIFEKEKTLRKYLDAMPALKEYPSEFEAVVAICKKAILPPFNNVYKEYFYEGINLHLRLHFRPIEIMSALLDIAAVKPGEIKNKKDFISYMKFALKNQNIQERGWEAYKKLLAGGPVGLSTIMQNAEGKDAE